MVIIKTPLRISLFGGSTDYESFYKIHGSFLIGTTIDKYSYLSMRFRPKILSKESIVMYSKMECVKHLDNISNPLIREVLRYKKVKEYIEFCSFADIPSRTGLGGSSSYSIGLLYLIDQLYGRETDKKTLIKDAITIERTILHEAGGIQDHIWPLYGGLNSIEIDTNGKFRVKPLPITREFYEELEQSVVLIYTNEQRNQENIARSHDGKDKLRILDISRQSYNYFLKENLKGIGELLYETWKEKRQLSSLISNAKIDQIINIVMQRGAYGAKLLGSGGCGFILIICNPKVKKVLTTVFKNDILPIKFDSQGVSRIY